MGKLSIHKSELMQRLRRISWRDVVANAVLIVAALRLITVPLILSTAGGFVDAYLNVLFFVLFALVLSRRRVVKLAALVLGIVAIAGVHSDHWQGMIYMKQSGRRTALENLGITIKPGDPLPTSRPSSSPSTSTTGTKNETGPIK